MAWRRANSGRAKALRSMGSPHGFLSVVASVSTSCSLDREGPWNVRQEWKMIANLRTASFGRGDYRIGKRPDKAEESTGGKIRSALSLSTRTSVTSRPCSGPMNDRRRQSPGTTATVGARPWRFVPSCAKRQGSAAHACRATARPAVPQSGDLYECARFLGSFQRATRRPCTDFRKCFISSAASVVRH